MLKNKSQAIVEYLILAAVIIIAVLFALNAGFAGKARVFFNNTGDTIGKIGH